MSQGGVPDPSVRASDADRERIVEQLRQHTADGRLSMDEFEQRMTAAYAARTYGELAQLTRDLPVDLGARARGGAAQPSWQQPSWQQQSPWQQPTPLDADQARRGNDPSDVVSALVGAAMDWKMQKGQWRDQLRAQRHQARLARRSRASVASSVGGWAFISVLLTGIWFMSGITSSHGFSDFWPIWPIGIIGLFTFLDVLKRVTTRR